jgi:hypothetical protein
MFDSLENGQLLFKSGWKFLPTVCKSSNSSTSYAFMYGNGKMRPAECGRGK